MPIYAYKCAACGHARDVLQKMSDAQLTDCPVCGAPQFQKQVTAAGFQLKGSGWYVTDFKGGSAGAAAPATGEAASTGTGTGSDSAAPAPAAPAATDSGKTAAAPASSPPPAPSSSS